MTISNLTFSKLKSYLLPHTHTHSHTHPLPTPHPPVCPLSAIGIIYPVTSARQKIWTSCNYSLFFTSQSNPLAISISSVFQTAANVWSLLNTLVWATTISFLGEWNYFLLIPLLHRQCLVWSAVPRVNRVTFENVIRYIIPLIKTQEILISPKIKSKCLILLCTFLHDSAPECLCHFISVGSFSPFLCSRHSFALQSSHAYSPIRPTALAVLSLNCLMALSSCPGSARLCHLLGEAFLSLPV